MAGGRGQEGVDPGGVRQASGPVAEVSVLLRRKRPTKEENGEKGQRDGQRCERREEDECERWRV